MKLLEKKSSNHRLGQGEINRSKKFHWYRKNSHSIREKKEKELHQLADRGSFANSTRTRNKITELLNKTVVDKGRGRRRDSVKNTDLSSSIDSKAHKYGSLPRFCLWLASIILAVGCIMADHSTGLKERKKEMWKRSHDIDPVAEYCLADLFWIDTLSYASVYTCVYTWNAHDVK